MDATIKENAAKLEKETNENADKLAQVTKECQERVADTEASAFQRIKQVQDEAHQQLTEHTMKHKVEVNQLSEAMETQRVEKDAVIKQLTLEKEAIRKEAEAQINQLEAELKSQEYQLTELKNSVIALTAELARKNDVESQLETQRNRTSQLDNQKEILQNEQLTASDYILDIENKLYKANKTSLELIRLLKEAEAENEQLQREKEYYQQELVTLKKRYELYIPVKGDPIDIRLAEYINNYPDRSRLKIMFQRESEGVYIFGTKRVNVRVDNNNINVRVGGGYLSIDEFIEQYTPSEMERMIRQDPQKKF